MKIEISRRAALTWLGLGSVAGFGTTAPIASATGIAPPVSPPNAQVRADFLSAILTWQAASQAVQYRLEISQHADMSSPLVDLVLGENVYAYRLPVAPNSTYFWRLTRSPDAGTPPEQGRFDTGRPTLDDTTDDAVRYRNPRAGARWFGEAAVQFAATEPLSPWFDQKAYAGPPAPRFDETTRKSLPVPVLEGEAALVDLYWYAWKTFFDVWVFAPTAPDHQAVANPIGFKTWGPWGSCMIWDTCFMLHFARYGHAAYPFITGLDNCYARQHENGFICRESDAQNREVYYQYPVNPPVLAWAEWEYFQISGDRERLRRVLMPLVKHYAWWMTYQRRENGLYWNTGMGEGMDDSPRNALAYYALSAAAEQALAALALSRIARVAGRDDLAAFFDADHKALGDVINSQFWDAAHHIYNDRTQDGRFITELAPGVLCKHAFIFWPLIAEVADDRGRLGLVAELSDPASFNRSSGIASLSADSAGFTEDGQYWKGSVWPPVQCIVQEGLRVQGQWPLARALAEKYLRAVAQAFAQRPTITENLAPDRPQGYGATEFVGWGGIGPIANLIEYVLGFQVKAPDTLIEWRIERTDRHGIENLTMGDVRLDLICDRRADSASPCHIAVQSSGACTLKVMVRGATTTHAIAAGRNQIIV